MMPIFIVLAKSLIISSILVLLKVIGRKTAIIYFSGAMGLFYLHSNPYAPETLLRNTVFLYFAFALLYSLAKKTIFYKKEERVRYPGKTKKQLNNYLLFFLAMFFYNSILILVFGDQRISFVLSVVFFFCVEIVSQGLSKNKIMKLLSKNKILLYLAADVSFALLNYIAGSMENSLFLLFLLFSFNIIIDSFAIWCPIGDLHQGMIPAEFVTRKNNAFEKQNISMFLNSILRQKAMNDYFGKKEVISPFNALTRRDIEKLKAGGIETLKIQKTINLSVFVVLGIVVSLFF